MQYLKLNFESRILGEPRTFVVEVPYEDGTVATSEFCPTEFLSGSVDLMAAIRGESLDKFMNDCRMQLLAMADISAVETPLDCYIGGLMSVVMAHLGRSEKISFADLLTYVDCFSLILKAAGFEADEIREIYPRVTRTIVSLYAANIDGLPQNL